MFELTGIPTNVVNPIQQYSHNNTRPTNRVLPMQTILPKCSPTEGSEIKSPPHIKSDLLKDLPNDHKKNCKENGNSTSNAIDSTKVKLTDESIKIEEMDIETTDAFENGDTNEQGDDNAVEDHENEFKIDKMEEDICIGNEMDDSDNSSDMDTFKDSFLRGSTAEEVFDKLKKEEQNSMLNNIEKQNAVNVKENISKIIENFENEDKTNLDEQDLFGIPEMASDIATVVSSDAIDTEPETQTNDVNSQHKESIHPIPMPSIEPLTKAQKLNKDSTISKATGPRLLYEIQSQDGFTYKSTSITEIWEKLFEAVQIARKAHGLSPLPVGPLADMCGFQMMGLKTNALKYLLEQLPGVERCKNYSPIYHKRAESSASQASSSGYWSDCEEIKENANGTARCERYKGRSEFDMFGWLASRHRKQPIQICAPVSNETEIIVRRGSGSSLPMAMRYRTLKETYKDSVGVYRSHIHGRGLFCNREIEAGK